MSQRAPWMPFAWATLGEHEIAGARDNPFIVACLAVAGLPHVGDETAWCGAFVTWVMDRYRQQEVQAGRAGPPDAPPGPAAARAWARYGRAATIHDYGAIAVLERPPNPAHGHTGFLVDTDGTVLWLLAGNQGNAVSVQAFPISRLVACRWPESGG